VNEAPADPGAGSDHEEVIHAAPGEGVDHKVPAASGEEVDHVIVADVHADPADGADKKLVTPPCCVRLSRGGWCLLPDRHEGGIHVGIPYKK
jgi:hypothetical protein